MDQGETISNFTEEPDGTWTISGVWVIKNFKQSECSSVSPFFSLSNDCKMQIKFLNYLNHVNTRVCIIIQMSSIQGAWPMDLNAKLLNVDPAKTDSKTTHVVFNSSALRSYIDFDVTWNKINGKTGFIDVTYGALRIEFTFRRTLRPYEMPITKMVAPKFVEPLPRPTIIDKAKQKYGVVGINTVDGNECLNCVILMLFSIPYFRNLVYSINTLGYEGTNDKVLPLQKLFSELQTADKAVSSLEFVKMIKWQKEHVLMTHLSDAFTAVISAVTNDKNKTEIEKMFQIQMKKITKSPYIKYEVSKDINSDFLELQLSQDHNKTFDELISNFSKSFEQVDEYLIPNSGAQTVFISKEVCSLPYCIFVVISRFLINFQGTKCIKLVYDMKIPISYNFYNLFPENKRFKNGIWDLQSMIVHSGAADEDSRFHALIRKSYNSDVWTEYRGYEVSEVSQETVLSSTDSIGLLYIMRNKQDLLYAPCEIDKIPSHIAIPAPLQDKPPYLITLITENNYSQANLRGETGCGTIGSYKFPAQRKHYVNQFAEIIASHLNIENVNRIIFWNISSEGRLTEPVPRMKTIEEVVNPDNLNLFLQVVPEKQTYNIEYNEAIVFLKFYWKNLPTGYPLQYIGSHRIDLNNPISSLYAVVIEKLKLSENTPLIPYLEDQSIYSASLLNQSSSFIEQSIKNGDCIVLQCPIEIPGFYPQYNFGEALPKLKPSPKFPSYDITQIPEDCVFIDLTTAINENGEDVHFNPDTVEIFYDNSYHLAIIGVTTPDSDEPQTFLRIPFSFPLDDLESKISFFLGFPPKVNFYIPTQDGKFTNQIIDRNTTLSLKSFFKKFQDLDKHIVTLYVSPQ